MDKWDEIKVYIVGVEGPINLMDIHYKTGISRPVIRQLVKKYAPEIKNCHPIIDWPPIEEEIRKQKDLGLIDDLKVAEKFGISKVTVQMHRLYKMGVGVRRNDFMIIGTPTLNLVNSSRREMIEKAIEAKRHVLSKSKAEMEIWLKGSAGKDFLAYLAPVSADELNRHRLYRNEAA